MILTFDQLAEVRGTVSMVDGAFDPLHAGHIDYFREAARLGSPLLCNIAADHYVRTKHRPLLPEAQRAVIIDALRDIAYTHISERDTETVLEQLRPRRYVKGKDWEGRLPHRQVEICAEWGIEICFLDTVRDSSSRLLQAFASGAAADTDERRAADDGRDMAIQGDNPR